MNAQQKTAAVKKYTGLKEKGANQDEVKDLLKQDPKNYTAAEQKEIVEAVFADAGTGTGAATPGPGTQPPASEVCGVNLQWEIVSHPTDLSEVIKPDQVRFIGTRDECTKFVADNSGTQETAGKNNDAEKMGYVDANWNVITETPDFSKGGLEMKFVGSVAACNDYITNNKPGGASAGSTAAPAAAATGTSPNDALDLSGFDYTDLTGKNFKKYVELAGDKVYTVFDSEAGTVTPLAGKLMQNESYDFAQYRAAPVFKPRFPGIPDSPVDFNGITIKNSTPEHVTRMSVANALEINSQILNQHSRAGHGRYYLLHKK